jgi:hypothetical protein
MACRRRLRRRRVTPRATEQEEVAVTSADNEGRERAPMVATVEEEEILSPAGATATPSGRTLMPEVDRRPTLRAR